MVNTWLRPETGRAPGGGGARERGDAGADGSAATATRPAVAPSTPARPAGSGSTLRVSPPRPRRLLFINQYYWPDHASTAQHLTDLAESLAAQGHECHVLCARVATSRARRGRPASEVHNGVHDPPRPGDVARAGESTLCRMTDYLSFYARRAGRGLRLPRFDVIVTLTTPPIIGLIGTLLRRLKGSRHVYWSMDLHPDASLALGRMSRAQPGRRAGSPG